MRIPLLVTCFALVLSSALAGQHKLNVSGGELIPEQACYDVLKYELSLAIDPDRRAIKGQLTMLARITQDTRRLALDLDSRLEVSVVSIDGKGSRAKFKDGRIWFSLGQPKKAGDTITITVDYSGKPRVAPRPPWDGGFTWAYTADKSHWIATSCQGEGADLWWPCKDHPSDEPDSMDLRITVPENLVVAANGVLQSDTRNGDGTRTFHWHVSNPVNNYGVALNIAPYEVIETKYESVTGESFPAVFYALPENADKARKAFPRFLDHLRFMEEFCGPYPFRNEKYGIVETPHLGMEHQSIIAYGNDYRVERDGYDWLHHHEMAHEWWANLVTCSDWKDMWIHEGIGSYMQPLYLEQLRGKKGYLAEMTRQRAQLNNRKAVAPREVQDSKQIYFGPDGGHDNDIYMKGSWICHTLRWYLGDEVFFKVLRRWAYPDPAMESVTDGTQCRFSDTEEIRAIAEKVSGKPLGWFFEVYLRQPELPELSVKRSGGKLRLEWKTPRKLPFPMPVPVWVGGELVRVEMPRGKAEIELPDGAEVRVDPDVWLLKK